MTEEMGTNAVSLSRLVAECPTPNMPFLLDDKARASHLTPGRAVFEGLLSPLSPLLLYYAKFRRPPWREMAYLTNVSYPVIRNESTGNKAYPV